MQCLTSICNISYRQKDAAQVLPLVGAASQCVLSVWLDLIAIDESPPITDKIPHEFAQSKALLAWHFKAYPTSGPCQTELTAR